MNDNQVRVGIGVMIKNKEEKYLFLKRKNVHGEGSWSPCGGHLEFGETFEECAKREAFEEAGIEIENIELLATTNDIFKSENKHYVSIYLIANYKSGEAKIMEPHKCEEIGWFEVENFPKPLFLTTQNLLKTGVKL